jgi:hypothetical protein
MFQQVCRVFNMQQVVDRDHLQFGGFHNDFQGSSSDPAKSIDCNSFHIISFFRLNLNIWSSSPHSLHKDTPLRLVADYQRCRCPAHRQNGLEAGCFTQNSNRHLFISSGINQRIFAIPAPRGRLVLANNLII